MSARPFRLIAPRPLEQDIHESTALALDRLLLPPAFWCCYPAGGVELPPHAAARLARMGLKRGLPDIIIWYFGSWGIELKRHGGKLSRDRIGRTRKGSPKIYVGQETVFPQLIAAGFAAIEVAHSVDEVLALIKKWGIPTRIR